MLPDYNEKLKENQELKEKNERSLKTIQSLQDRLVQSKEEYNTQFEKCLKISKENEKLKIIITKLLEEKYCNEGE